MKPQKIYLKNFIGIKTGLNRDEIEINLTEKMNGNPLVAIVGPNGSGKTTLMDSLHPYRIMASRAKSYSPGAFSYYDNTYDDAEKRLHWEHNGVDYESVINISGTLKTKKTYAYLFTWGERNGIAEWVPVTLKDGTCSDGKTATYDTCVEAIMGTPEMFFTSAFSAQSKRALSSYTNSEIKGFLAELLKLEDIRDLGEKARFHGNKLKTSQEALGMEVVAMQGKEDERNKLSANQEALSDDASNAEEERRNGRDVVSAANQKLAEVKINDNANLELEKTRQGLRIELKKTSLIIEEVIGQGSYEKAACQEEIEKAEGKKRKVQMAHQKSMNELEEQIANSKELQKRSDEVEAAKKEVERLGIAIKEARHKLGEYENLEVGRNELTVDLAKAKGQLRTLTQEGKSCAEQLDSLKTRAELIDRVPCSGMDINATCQLLANANAAKGSIPGVVEADKNNRGEYVKLQKVVTEFNASIESLGDMRAMMDAQKDKLDVLQTELNTAQKITALEGSIENASSVILSTESQKESLNEASTASIDSFNEFITDKKAEYEKAEKKCAGDMSKYGSIANKLKTELAAMPPASDTSAVEMATNQVLLADKSLERTEHRLRDLRIELATITGQIVQLTEALRRDAYLVNQMKEVEDEIGYWTQLTKALGNNGIIALSIDDAGPTLASIANDLLASAYGPRFSVSIRTQAAKADGDLKEVFDVIVFDADTDTEKSIAIMSGGERIYINEALVRAIAIYQAQVSGQQYKCLFADESDGALDTEKKQQFIAMKRKMLALGGYDNEIFISHTPEVCDLADSTIDMQDYRL